jgi:CheY-like chemotaxis protein
MNEASRVQVVDDDADVREFTAVALRQAGYTVDEAADGQEALELVQRTDYDVILLDWQMPRMDGCTFLDAYASLPGPHAAIVLCTALPAFVEPTRITPAGYLCKPFGPAELYRAMNCRMR